MRVWMSLLIALMLTGCGVSRPDEAFEHSVDVRYGLTRDFRFLDPHLDNTPELGVILSQIYDTLVYKDPRTGEFVGGLALDWSRSDDGLTYTFRLRDDVIFHDGTPFNAQAVAVNLERITNPEIIAGQARSLLGTYAGYRVIDDRTIQIQLETPFEPLLDSLSQFYLGMASPTALAEYSIFRYQFHQIGTGPYRLVEYLPGNRIILERNPQYDWQPSFYDLVALGNRPNRISFEFVLDVNQRAARLLNQQVDIMSGLTPNDARTLAVNADLRLTPIRVPGLSTQLLMNVSLYPTDNLLVRQALLFGTNRSALVDRVYQGFAPVAWGPLTGNMLFYSQEMPQLYSYDAIQARTLIEQAGFNDNNNDGFFEIGGVPLAVTLLIPQQPQIQEAASLLAEQWRIIGAATNIVTVATTSTLQDTIERGQYNLIAIERPSSDPSVLNDFFLADGAQNWSNYQSAELDQLLTVGTEELERLPRAGAYVLAQRQIMENALTLPLWDTTIIYGARSTVNNLTFSANGLYPLLGQISLNAE